MYTFQALPTIQDIQIFRILGFLLGGCFLVFFLIFKLYQASESYPLLGEVKNCMQRQLVLAYCFVFTLVVFVSFSIFFSVVSKKYPNIPVHAELVTVNDRFSVYKLENGETVKMVADERIGYKNEVILYKN